LQAKFLGTPLAKHCPFVLLYHHSRTISVDFQGRITL
jgi:hypothetical protein